ncbi:MAG: GIY-YIG nuclease family protein [Cyanobacteria bacterium P01_H01_bin.105]
MKFISSELARQLKEQECCQKVYATSPEHLNGTFFALDILGHPLNWQMFPTGRQEKFTNGIVEKLANHPAVYAIVDDDEVLYIGQTKNIYQRWRSHEKFGQVYLLKDPILCWFYWSKHNHGDLLDAETALILTYSPPWNDKKKLSVQGKENYEFYSLFNSWNPMAQALYCIDKYGLGALDSYCRSNASRWDGRYFMDSYRFYSKAHLN